ncbi:MAG: ribbon-helix-helix protein, CopG family [Clostridia bacterium]|nr:ribbon-helix-helix protein, CopG family [Clostridia bacterium]
MSVRLKEGTLEKIDDLSLKSNRSRNEIINILLESSVEDAEVE